MLTTVTRESGDEFTSAVSINFGSHSGLLDVLNVVALFMSVAVAGLAVWFTVRESRRNQARSELSVAPAINNEQNLNEDQPILGQLIRNVGNGPAIVEAVFFVYRGVYVEVVADPPWFRALDTVLQQRFPWLHADLRHMPVNPIGVFPGAVLGGGTAHWIASYPRASLNGEQLRQFQQFVTHSSVVVFYKSVHGRRYVTLGNYNPEGNLKGDQTPEQVMTRNYAPPAAPGQPPAGQPG